MLELTLMMKKQNKTLSRKSVTTALYKQLESSLSTSTGHQRKKWATKIIEKDIEIKNLSGLLNCDQKIATRFLWMLSDVGILEPKKLLRELPILLNLCEDLNPNYKTSFASFWLYTGVPTENEGIAINLLFSWILSTDTNITIKSRSLLVLFELTKKYPELKSELILCIKDQMGKYTKDFEKRTNKILLQLEK